MNVARLVPPGGATAPLRHLYTEAIYVVSGHGSTSVWRGASGTKQTFEWGPGSYFVLPTNASHQFFNASLSRPARWFSVTDLPQLLRQWASEDFIFNNPYDFADRYAGGAEYFTAEAKLYKGRVWETNFIPDIKKLPLYEWKSRGGGGTNAFMVMGAGMMESHVSRFESGHYKKGHRHGPGAHLYITEGEGFVFTQRGNEPRIRCDWQEGSLYLSGAGEGQWLHQHFNVGAKPARYLALHSPMQFYGHAEKVEDRAKDQIEYTDEDPWIRKKFADELSKRGVQSLMPDEAYTNRDYEWSKAMGKQ